jgi:hypothetical protein
MVMTSFPVYCSLSLSSFLFSPFISLFHVLSRYFLPRIYIRGCIQKFPDWVITKLTITTTTNTRWEATQRVMAAKTTRLTHKIAIQLHLVAESCNICSSRSRRPVRKLFDTPSWYNLKRKPKKIWFRVHFDCHQAQKPMDEFVNCIKTWRLNKLQSWLMKITNSNSLYSL